MPNTSRFIALLSLVMAGCASISTSLAPFKTDGCSMFPDRSLTGKADWCDCCLAVEFQEVVHGRDAAHGRLAVQRRVWPMPVVAVQEGLQGGLSLR